VPRLSQDPVPILYGSAVPVAPPTLSQLIRDLEADQWIWTLTASGGLVTIVTTGAYLWWYYAGAWRRDARPWNVPGDLLLADGDRVEDVTRARPGATGAYLQLASVTGATLTVTLEPARGGS